MCVTVKSNRAKVAIKQNFQTFRTFSANNVDTHFLIFMQHQCMCWWACVSLWLIIFLWQLQWTSYTFNMGNSWEILSECWQFFFFFFINWTQERFFTSTSKILHCCTMLSIVIILVGAKTTNLSGLEFLSVLLYKNQSGWRTHPCGEWVDKHSIKEYLPSDNEIFGLKIPPANRLSMNWGNLESAEMWGLIH